MFEAMVSEIQKLALYTILKAPNVHYIERLRNSIIACVPYPKRIG